MNREAIDLSKIRPGDEIAIRATVTEAQRGNECWPVRATIDGISNIAGMFDGEFCFSPSAIASHTPKALAVGDRVKPSNFVGKPGSILAVDGDEAWVRWGVLSVKPVWRLSDLERA